MTDFLKSAIDPKSIAIIGASENVNKIGGRPIHYMQRQGYAGRIYPINPGRAEIQGLKSIPRSPRCRKCPTSRWSSSAATRRSRQSTSAPGAASRLQS
jgi:hypothetical protein